EACSASGCSWTMTGAAVKARASMARVGCSFSVDCGEDPPRRLRVFGGADTYAARNWVSVSASDFRMPRPPPPGRVNASGTPITARESAPEKVFRPIRYDRCRSEEHTSELQSRENLVCRLLPEKT